MGRIITIIAENIFVVLGFALDGAIVYYMIARALRRYVGRKSSRRRSSQSRRHSIMTKERSKIYPESGIEGLFTSLFSRIDPDGPDKEPPVRRNFSKSFPGTEFFSDSDPKP